VREFFSRYYGIIYSFAKSFVSQRGLNPDIVDDIVQAVCIKLLIAMQRNTIRKVESIRSYISAMIRHTIIDFVRKEKSYARVSIDNIENIFAAEDDVMLLDRINLDDAKKLIAEAMDKFLSSSERDILWLWQRGASDKEIAESLGIGVSSVYTLKSRAIKKLRAYLKEVKL
jgi:RNA polymerase sigma factor (sigma-70 family)